MMTDDELADLAADIKANGLLHRIVVDFDGTLIDGRNRLRACELAEVEPLFHMIDGAGAKAHIVSANLARRNLKKGQQAMALAMIYPEPERGRGKKDEALGKLPESGGFKRERLRQARAVLRHSRAMALAMIYPEPAKGGRGKLSGFSDSLGVSRGHARDLLSGARAVLRHSRALAEDVLADRTALDARGAFAPPAACG